MGYLAPINVVEFTYLHATAVLPLPKQSLSLLWVTSGIGSRRTAEEYWERVSDSDLIIQYGGPLPKRINSGEGDSPYEGAGDTRRLA